ncbi:MAG: hypothetical protein ACYTAF_07125 [Planctomycetota bacterium]
MAASDAFGQIDGNPEGPTTVYADDDDALYESTVTTDYSFLFRLKVYHEGTKKHESLEYVVTSGPSVLYQKTVNFTGWGLSQGDELDFLGRATIRSGPYRGSYDEDHWYVIVSGYALKVLPREGTQTIPVEKYAMREELA